MLDEATSPERRFDIICVHAFSRFYRNGAEMELTIRKLRKHGVEVVSVTQPTGDDPSQEMMRQIIGIFDEYTSRENGKNVIRAMRESAKQGFWNGTTPPLGYRIVAAERRGSKVKKRLEIDPVEAELVRLIFRLYAEGDGRSGPLGVKETTKWLNEHGLSHARRVNLWRRSAPSHSQERLLRDGQMALWAPKLPHRRLARSRHHHRDRNPTNHPARSCWKRSTHGLCATIQG